MVSSDEIRTIVGIIGNVISFGLFVSPIPTFVRIIKNKTTEEYKPDPYLATVLNCAIWIFYGLPIVHPDSLLVITINSIGLAMELIFVSIFFTYCAWANRKKIMITLACELVFVILVVILVLELFHGTKARTTAVGILCVIFNILMYASPLTVMQKVIRTKSVNYMPFTLSLANFLNGIVWLIYALLKFDIYIVIPNGLGALSGILQLILYATYYKPTQRDENDKEVQMT